ncbi:hypothetical protein ACFOU2_15700 [Bacillus songklensis]|uniref:Malectin domain-containing protein n=1 Tax=Bacillus songklensis TaxID=1069116 RepID=A0ABV8B4K1_9BACI
MGEFGNFWQKDFITVALNDAFPWSNQGPRSRVKLDPSDNTKIIVNNAGKYKIDFVVFIENLASSTFYPPSIQVTINGKRIGRARFALQLEPNTVVDECLQLTGTVIINVRTDHSVIQLINRSASGGDSTDISTCDAGPVAATINLVKVS